MDAKIKISNPSEYTIEVNDNGDTISMDFSDIEAVERYNKATVELERIRKEMVKVSGRDTKGVEGSIKRTEDLLALLVDGYGVIDTMFGEGASEKIFGGKKTITGFFEFFSQITPHIKKAMQKTRTATNAILDKYTVKEETGKVLK